jgi:formate dehydrogenase iron-sulfur subunit
MNTNTKHWSILTDVTKCIGCESCVEGCREANHTGNDRPWAWQNGVRDLSASRWTTIDRLPENHYVRRQCRHCISPACASACPVGALSKTPEGAVVYDAVKCMGCRYCMMACPFGVPRYSWDSAVPEVRKCVLCHDRIKKGEAKEPACTSSCPTGATIFGPRDEMLAEAKKRLAAKPDFYKQHIWGEHEAGGTGVLTISDVDLPLPMDVPEDALPKRTWAALRTVPFVFVGVGAGMIGLRFIIGRRNEIRAVEAEAKARQAAAAVAEESTEQSPEENDQ